MATPRGQNFLTMSQQKTCLHHKGRQLEWYCESCPALVCSKCISSLHKSHSIIELSDFTPKIKQNIQNFVNRIEKHELVDIQRQISSSQDSKKKNLTHFGNISLELRKQGERLKHDIDVLVVESLSLYQQLEVDNNQLLDSHIEYLQEKFKDLKDRVENCKFVLQKGTDLDVVDTGNEISSEISIPAVPNLGTAQFSPNRTPHGHLEQALGTVTMTTPGGSQDQTKPLVGVSQSGRSQPSAGVLPPKASKKGRALISPPQSRSLLPQTKVVTEFISPCDIRSVCATRGGGVWVCNYSSTVTLLDRGGGQQQEIQYKVWVGDISTSPTTDNLWACSWDGKTIMEVTSGSPVTRFSTDGDTLCLCVTMDNHVVVGMLEKVSKFSIGGKLVITTGKSKSGKSLATPHKITECGVTGHLAVVDRDLSWHGGNGKQHVVVVDTDLQEVYRYHSDIPPHHTQTRKAGHCKFDPFDAVFDSVGNLVIGDYNNRCLHLLSGSGEYLRLLHTDLEQVLAVSVDRYDVLWGVFYKDGSHKVKLLQYSVSE